MKNKTAVEWFFETLFEEHGEFTMEQIESEIPKLWEVYQEALKKETKQTKDAYLRGIENYDPTFKTKQNEKN